MVTAEHGNARDLVAARERGVEHADDGVEPASDDGVDHLTPLVGTADDHDAAHDALPRNRSMVAWSGALTPCPPKL